MPSPDRSKPKPRRAASRRGATSATPLDRVRRMCLALPDTAEKIAWGTPTFRVRGRIFVMFVDNHHRDGRVALWCPAPEGAQAALVRADPEHFFVPPYVGPSGWLGIRLDRDLDWSAIEEFVSEAYHLIAAKRSRAGGRRSPK